MLAVTDNISSKLIGKHSSLGAIVVSVLCNNKEITICLLYVPPDANQSHHETLLEYLSSLSCHDHLLILDVNLPDVDWENYQGYSDFSSQFSDKSFELNLEQLVDKPTHISGNILDVVLANFVINQPTVSDAHLQGLPSDHFIINFSVPTSSHTVEQKASYVAYDYSRADWDSMYNSMMNHNFHEYCHLSDVEEVWATLKHILQAAIQAFVPQFLVKKKQHPNWFTPTIKHRLNCIHSLRRKYKKNPSSNLKLKLQAEEDNLQAFIVEAKSDYESNLISNYASGNHGFIYKYISSLSKSYCLPLQMHLGTDTATCDQDKARLFNSYFYSVFNDKDLTNDSLTATNETSTI